MSSFSNEQIKKVVDLYFKYNSKIEKVRCELGYSERHTLKKWVDEVAPSEKCNFCLEILAE